MRRLRAKSGFVRGASFFLTVLVATFALTQDIRISASEALLRSMSSDKTVVVTLVQKHLGGFGPRRDTFQYRIEYDGNGNSRRTVLQPLANQGVEVYDDGRKMTILSPDDRRIDIQDSPNQMRLAPSKRLALAKANYSLTLEKKGEIAGRSVVKLTAKPRNKGLEGRRYFLDSDNFLMLRLESFDDSGKTTVMVDTQAVSFPSRPATLKFTLSSKEEYSIHEGPSPIDISDSKTASKILGFLPRRPSKVPLGFAVYAVHLLGKSNPPVAAVRLTDGLVLLTVYQSRGGERPMRGAPRASLKDDFGVTYMVSGQAPREVRDTIGQSFVKEGNEAKDPMSGFTTTTHSTSRNRSSSKSRFQERKQNSVR